MRFKNTKDNNIIVADKEFIDSLPNAFDYVEQSEVQKTTSEQQAEKIKQLHENYSEFYKTYTESYSTLEVESFKDKADEAKAYMRDNTASTPYVDAMAGGDPLVRVEILNAIWAKVAYLASVEGQVVSKRDAIKLATTQTELDLINVAF